MTENLKPNLMLGFNNAFNHYSILPPSQKMVIFLSSKGELLIRNYFNIQPRQNNVVFWTGCQNRKRLYESNVNIIKRGK